MEPTSAAASQDAVRTSSTVSRAPLAVTVVYLLSEAGRKASLLGGGDGRAVQQVTIQVSRNRLHLVSVDARGRARLTLRPRFEIDAERQRVVQIDAPPEYDALPSAEQLLGDASRYYELSRRFRDEQAAASAQRDAAERELKTQLAGQFLADSARRAIVYPAPTRRRCRLQIEGSRRTVLFDVATDAGDLAKVPQEAHRRFRLDLQAKRDRSQQLHAEQQAVHAEKVAQVSDWIAEHGTDDQKARQALGLLPFPEAIEAITSQLLAPLDRFPRYQRDGATLLQTALSAGATHKGSAIGPKDLDVQSTDAQSVSQRQWEQLEQMRALAPEGFVVTLRIHRISAKALPRVSVVVFSALVTGRVGSVAIRREYGAPGLHP